MTFNELYTAMQKLMNDRQINISGDEQVMTDNVDDGSSFFIFDIYLKDDVVYFVCSNTSDDDDEDEKEEIYEEEHPPIGEHPRMRK